VQRLAASVFFLGTRARCSGTAPSLCKGLEQRRPIFTRVPHIHFSRETLRTILSGLLAKSLKVSPCRSGLILRFALPGKRSLQRSVRTLPPHSTCGPVQVGLWDAGQRAGAGHRSRRKSIETNRNTSRTACSRQCANLPRKPSSSYTLLVHLWVKMDEDYQRFAPCESRDVPTTIET
jgi:hypothetical protein